MSDKKPKSMKMPMVAIVGRPNVGKSSLLNAMAGRLISIVQDMPGVTRDRISTPVDVNGKFVELVDTGGWGFDDPDQLTQHIREQIEAAMNQADMVLFVVDCMEGLTSADQEVAKLLRDQGLKTVLIANKADGPKADVALGEFARLGLGTPIGVSALHARNIDLIIEAIRKNVDLKNAPEQLPAAQMMVAIVGKRNAGKSTLVNAIAELFEGEKDRVIVSEVPGTTRDSVDVRFEKDGKVLIVIDTAGVRKKRQMVSNDIEFYSFHRAERSIRRADVVLMLIDGTEPLSEPDKKLARYIAEQFKPVMLVVNKWDLTKKKFRAMKKMADEESVDDSELMDEYGEYLEKELPQLPFAPVAFVTAKDGRNIQAVVDLAQHLSNQAAERVTTGQLNRALRQILDEKAPSSRTSGRPKIYYATQVDISPPTIVLMVNKVDLVDIAYQKFVANRLRELLPYPEVPIKLVVRGKTRQDVTPAVDEDPEYKVERSRSRPKMRPKARRKRG